MFILFGTVLISIRRYMNLETMIFAGFLILYFQADLLSIHDKKNE